jgi:hypothetical protein
VCCSIISASWNVPAIHGMLENISTMPKAQNHSIFLICWWCPHDVTKKTEQTLIEFSEVQPTIKFTIGEESQNTFPGPYNIPGKKLNFTVYWKPTSADYIIHHELCHPYEHTLWSMTYLKILNKHTTCISSIQKVYQDNTEITKPRSHVCVCACVHACVRARGERERISPLISPLLIPHFQWNVGLYL